MRSRYSAYVKENEGYLLETWSERYRPKSIEFLPHQRWLGLKIKRTDAGSENDASGSVEFVARFKVNGKGHRLHETSRFERVDDRWFYMDGELKE